MHVLHLCKSYFPDSIGGIENFIDQLIISTKPYGATAEVVTLTRDKQMSVVEIHGYKVHKIPQNFQIASCPFSFKAIRYFAMLAKCADVVHYHFPFPFADLLHLMTRVKQPAIITYHSDIIKQNLLLLLYSPIMRRFLNKMQYIIATSPNYILSSAVLTKMSSKVTAIQIGIDQNSYPVPDPEKLNFWRNKFGGRFFLYIGVMRYYKGLEFLITASIDLEVPIVIVGGGRLVDYLKSKVAASGIKNIYFVGAINEVDKAALLTLCYAFVFPSYLRSEAFGIALLEAAMFGKPLISCAIATGTTYINIHNKTGIVVPPADAKALNVAMRYLLDNQDMAKIFGQGALQRYFELFTADRMAQSYMAFYHGCLKAF